MRLRVATFNIRHGLGADGVLDLDRTAEVIRSLDAGLVALQELDRNLERSGFVDQPRELTRRGGLKVHFAPAVEIRGGEYGIALAADDDLETEYLRLPRVDGEEPRAAITATWQSLGIVATHLAREAGPRDAQMHALARIARNVGPPAVVAGDLNQRRRGLGPLRRAGFDPGPLRATLGVRRQVDYVLASRGVRIVDLRAVDTAASDHRPVVADIEF
jgi:endonuclease/exonuclease/phosphatase family metal-dependent hydrolase